MVSCRQAYQRVRQALEKAGIEDAAFDAKVLLELAAGKAWRWRDAPLSEAEQACLRGLAQKRVRRVPLQYLAGRWPFLDFELAVGPGVLVPRADTELLCETAAQLLAKTTAPQVLDLCAGSGCVGIGIKSLVPACIVTCLEKSSEALPYLEQNAKEALAGRSVSPAAEVVQGDVFGFETTLEPQSLELIASNPPYVTEEEMEALAPELSFEPRAALCAAKQGLAFYHYIAPAYKKALCPGGWLVFEIGCAQGGAVLEILEAAGYECPACKQDLAGNDRVVLGRRPL